jgi:hypothetical protein
VPLKTPDVTPAQLLAVLTAAVGLLLSQGVITAHTAQLVGGLASIVLPVFWVVADAIIRRGRAQVAAAIAQGVPAGQPPARPEPGAWYWHPDPTREPTVS